MNILFPIVELEPLVFVGNLGKVMSKMLEYLYLSDNKLFVCLPYYKKLDQLEYKINPVKIQDEELKKDISGYTTKFFELEIDNKKIYLIKNNHFFYSRKNIYGYDDDNYRFVFFCNAIIELIKLLDFTPDIAHIHDWHTSLLTLLLKENNYKTTKTVLTLHDINFQGISNTDILDFAGISKKTYSPDKIEFYNTVNILKAGLFYSNIICTNSENYLKDIQEDNYISKGLSGVINYLSDKTISINTGIDKIYNSENDSNLVKNYSVDNLSGKEYCKSELQKDLDFPIHSEIPLMVIPSVNITNEEILLLNAIIPYLIKMEIQIVILGYRLVDFERTIREVSFRINCSAISLEDNITNRKKVLSGSDIILDCSLNSSNDNLLKIALKYGVVPIVFKESLDLNLEDNKFKIFNFTPEDLINTIKYTINRYYYLEKWNEKVKKIMKYDFSWEKTVNKYIDVYNKLIS